VSHPSIVNIGHDFGANNSTVFVIDYSQIICWHFSTSGIISDK